MAMIEYYDGEVQKLVRAGAPLPANLFPFRFHTDFEWQGNMVNTGTEIRRIGFGTNSVPPPIIDIPKPYYPARLYAHIGWNGAPTAGQFVVWAVAALFENGNYTKAQYLIYSHNNISNTIPGMHTSGVTNFRQRTGLASSVIPERAIILDIPVEVPKGWLDERPTKQVHIILGCANDDTTNAVNRVEIHAVVMCY